MKNPIFKGGSQKTNTEGRITQKGGLGQFADLWVGGGGLGKKVGVVFLRGVDTPMHTMI